MTGARIAAIRLLCPDPVQTAAFYEAAFGADTDRHADPVQVRLGRQILHMVATGAGAAGPLAPSNATTFQHCALVAPDMAAAYERLRRVAGWRPISLSGPETLPASSGGVAAFKFRDPDGHPLELLSFRADATPPIWRRDGAAGSRHGATVLGIDHTAITVSDTERSIAFYGRLGFTVSGRGVNRGVEQARMDGLADPLVEVTSLALPETGPPHLELLCYRQPGTILARVGPRDVLATAIVVAGAAGAPLPATDPDGHRLLASSADA